VRSSLEAPERARIAYPRAYWYGACTGGETLRRPIARTLLGIPLVLFRSEQGSPAALLDRCAHRNLPLSEGRVIGQQIECAYHGWRYDGQGRCRRVPALAETADHKGRSVPTFPTVEQQGYIWVFTDPDRPPSQGPYRFPHLDTPGYASVRFASQTQATLHATLENMLDVQHTAFLHRGLFRGGPKRPITAIVRRFGDRVEAEYVGEPRPSGLLGRLLAPRGGTVEHFDRFLVPSIAQVEYRLGESHLLITVALTPVGDFPHAFLRARQLSPAAARGARARGAPPAGAAHPSPGRAHPAAAERGGPTIRRRELRFDGGRPLGTATCGGSSSRPSRANSQPPGAAAPELEKRVELHV